MQIRIHRSDLAVATVALVLGASSSARAQTADATKPVAAFLAMGLAGQTPASRYFDLTGGIAAGGGIELATHSAIALRGEVMGFFFLTGESASADCVIGGPCVDESSADFAGILSLSAKLRPADAPLYFLAGGDFLYAPRTSSQESGTTTGLNVGIGTSLGHARKYGIEARYHAPRRDLGLMKALFQVTLNFRL
jgi:hypothetical protein